MGGEEDVGDLLARSSLISADGIPSRYSKPSARRPRSRESLRISARASSVSLIGSAQRLSDRNPQQARNVAQRLIARRLELRRLAASRVADRLRQVT